MAEGASPDMRLSQALAMGLGSVEFLIGLAASLFLFAAMPDVMTTGQALRGVGLILLLTAVPLALVSIAVVSDRAWVSRFCAFGCLAIIGLWTGLIYA